MVLAANVEPLSKPSSPPKKSPPPPKKKYVAKSPRVVGLSNGVMSGIGSKCGVSYVRLVEGFVEQDGFIPVRPLANCTCVGFSAALKASNTFIRLVLRRKAR